MTFTFELDPGPAPALTAQSECAPWLDGDGRICARLFRGPSTDWIDWLDAGVFRIASDSSHVQVWPRSAHRDQDLVDLFHLRIQPLVLQSRGYQALHASAVAIRGAAAALAGVSGSGKSTLARALASRGHLHLADDAVVMRMGSKVDVCAASDKIGLAAVVLLTQDRERGPAPELRRITGPTACTSLLAHAHVFDEADRKRVVTDYARLADEVPIYRLAFRPVMSELPELIRAVEGLAEVSG